MAKFYYGGVLLPEIPAEVLENFPYCWIRHNPSSGYYDLIFSALQPYLYTDNASIAFGTGTTADIVWYRVAIADTMTSEWVHYSTSNTWFGIDTSRTVIWSNCDMLRHSITATDVYLAGSHPTPIIESVQEYIVNDGGWYVSGGNVAMDTADGTLIKYLFQIKTGVVYTFKSLEAHNRLRAMVTTADMSVVTGTVSGTLVGTERSDVPAGTTLTHQSTFNGWMCVYVSNAGEKPAVEVIAYEPVGLRVRQHIEAEDGILAGSAVIDDRLSTSGNIVVDMVTSSGGTLTLDFIAPANDFYVIRMYATLGDTRSFKYAVNGKTYDRSITGTTYYGVETFDFPLYLNAGSNTITFKGSSTYYTPMFDAFEVCSYAVGYEEGEVADCFNLRDVITTVVGQSFEMEPEWLNGFDANALRRAYINYQYNEADEYLGCSDAVYNEADKSYQLTFYGYQNALGSIKLTATLATTSIVIDSIEVTNNTSTWSDSTAQFAEVEMQMHLLKPCGASHANCFKPVNAVYVTTGRDTALADGVMTKIGADSLYHSFVTLQHNTVNYAMGCIEVVPTGFNGYELTFFTHHVTLGAFRVKVYVDALGAVVSAVEADSNTGAFAIITEQFSNTAFELNLLEVTTKGSSSVTDDEFSFNFSESDWRTAYPDFYSVADSNGFYTASTFQYSGKDTLRSYGIGNSGVSQTTITFNLVVNGSVAFNYCVTSETNYDWLSISIDDTEVVKKSGTVAWTDYSKELPAGTHTLTLKYTKDGSGATSPDAGAIGYLKITGLFSELRYLVRSNSVVYTVNGEDLQELGIKEITSLLFRLYGSSDAPTSELVRDLINPEILLWSDLNKFTSDSTVTMIAEPYPQTIESPDYDMTDETILGIEKAVVTATESVQFAVSFDSGSTWMTYTGTNWAELSENASGMSANTLNAIPTESWNAVATTGKFRFRISLMDNTSEFTSLVVDYLNEAETSV